MLEKIALRKEKRLSEIRVVSMNENAIYHNCILNNGLYIVLLVFHMTLLEIDI